MIHSITINQVESREENKMINMILITLGISIVWGSIVAYTQNCTDGQKVGMRFLLNPKFLRNSTIPIIAVCWMITGAMGTAIVVFP